MKYQATLSVCSAFTLYNFRNSSAWEILFFPSVQGKGIFGTIFLGDFEIVLSEIQCTLLDYCGQLAWNNPANVQSR